MSRLTHVALTIGLLTWALPAAAQTSRPLVVDVTTMNPTPRTGPIEDFLEEVSPLKPGTYPVVSLADPDIVERLRWRMPTQAGAECQSTPADLGSSVSDARAAWNQLDLDTALTLISKARRELPCQAELIHAQDLKVLIFMEGAVHFFLEDGQAGATFSELAALYPNSEPEPGFSPEIQQSFRQATAQARQGPDIVVKIPPEMIAMQPYLDGMPIREGTTSMTVKSGRHIVQIVGPRGEVRTELFTVFPGVEENLEAVGQIIPDRTQVIGATVRAQISSERLDLSVAQGLSRYAQANDHSYLLFLVPDPTGEAQMRVLTLDPETARLSSGLPEGLSSLPKMDSGDGPSGDTPATGVKPPRRYDPTTTRRRLKVEPTDTRAGMSMGVLVYDGVPFVTLEPSFDKAIGPVAVMVTGIYGLSSGETGTLNLPGMRIGLLKRFYVGQFAPHVGLDYEILAARTVTAAGQNILLIEGTPELFGGTEFAFNDSGLRLTARTGVAYTPGGVVLGNDNIEGSSRLAISATLGAAWTW